MAMISVKNLCKEYGENKIFDNLNLDIFDGEVLAILGESGSGKTTLLNILAGLTEFMGEINGVQRPISMVFQKDMLVKNLTVKENLLLDLLLLLMKNNTGLLHTVILSREPQSI